MLTYSCPTEAEDHPIPSKEELLEHLKTLRNAKKGVVSKESHADGRTHYHAALEFDPKLNTRDTTFFDFCEVHPNVGTRDNWKAMIKYTIKDGDYCTWNIDAALLTNTAAPKKDARADLYTKALELARTGKIDDARRTIREGDPVRWCLNMTQIQASLQTSFNEGKAESNPTIVLTTRWVTPYTTIDLNAKEDGEDWIRTVVLCGPPGIGKTQLAKLLLQNAGCKRIEVVRTAEMLRHCIDSIDGFVFDELNANAPDVRGGRWTRESQIALVDRQEEGSLPARYSDIQVKRHIIRIITTNELTRALNWNDGAIDRRIKVYQLGDVKLFQ